MSTLCMSQCDPPFEKSWLRPCSLSSSLLTESLEHTSPHAKLENEFDLHENGPVVEAYGRSFSRIFFSLGLVLIFLME